MHSRVLLAVALLCGVPATTHAITITAGDHILAPETAGQNVDILLSGAGGADFYSRAEMRTLIGAGGPVVTHVFGDTSDDISPSSLMDGSIWASAGPAQGSIIGTPNGTWPTDSGLQTAALFTTFDFTNVTANGIYATLTLDTTGVSPGVYSFGLTDHPNGDTQLFFFIPEVGFELVDTVLINGTLTVTPEPGTMALSACALAALAAWSWRRRKR